MKGSVSMSRFTDFVAAHPANRAIKIDPLIDGSELIVHLRHKAELLAKKAEVTALNGITAVFDARGVPVSQTLHGRGSMLNQRFIKGKFNVCREFGISSLAVFYKLEHEQGELEKPPSFEDVYGDQVPAGNYAAVGGGIPLMLGGVMVAVALVSGLRHELDHKFIVGVLGN